MSFFENVAGVYNTDANLDRADLVQTILIMAFVAIAAIAVMGLLMQAVNNKSKDTKTKIDAASPTLTSIISTL